MSINLGSFPVHIHLTVGEGAPTCIGTAHIPLTAETARLDTTRVAVGSPMVAARAAVAKVLREAADEIENPT